MSKRLTDDDNLKVQYQKELNAIHAPKELTEKVKLAVEQAGQEKKGVSDTGYMRWAAAVAAAAVIVLLFWLVIFREHISEEDNYEKTPIQLGTESIKDTEYIGKEEYGTEIDGLIINITDKAWDEVPGKELEDMVICDIPVVLSINVINGYYQCFFEDGEQRYIITSKTADKEEFLEKLYGFFDAE